MFAAICLLIAECKIHNPQSSTVIGIGVPDLREHLLEAHRGRSHIPQSEIRNPKSSTVPLQYFPIPVKIPAIGMRCFSTFFVALFLLAVSVRGEENTAYTALRLIGNLRGEETLKQVLAVSGESGNPQPGMWTVVLEDPAARGGVRELQIVSNQVASERTPVSSELAGGKTIDLNQLNLDSDGAYQVAQEEAKKNGASFDQVNYRLFIDSDSGKPLWVVHLVDTQQQDVGIVKVAADNGTLVSSSNWTSSGSGGLASQGSSPNPDQEVLDQTPESSEQPPIHKHRSADTDSEGRYVRRDYSNEDGSISDRARRYGQSVGNTVERAFRKAGGWIQKKVTGKDTISLPPRNDTDESDSNQDQYSQPVHPQQVPE
jgi:hypothetical protein